MRIIIIGAGEIGFYLAKRLSFEKHNLIIIDEDPEKCAKAQEALDIVAVQGSGSSQSVLREAELEGADMLIAASARDEVNILACMFASRAGVGLKVARVRDADLYSPSSLLKPQDIGVDLLIHPEAEVVEEVIRLLMRSVASEIIEFESGKILFVGLKLDKECPYLNYQLKSFGAEEIRRKFRIVAMKKGETTIIPGGNDYLNNNDQLFVVTKADDLPELLAMTGRSDRALEKIMVLGGGRIGLGVAQSLEDSDLDVTLVEADKERSRKAAGQLKKSMVLQADGTEFDVLAREGILEMDAFVALTNDDETNIISCLLARHLGVKKTIALVNRLEYLPLMSVIGIDSTVNVRLATANAILRLIRRGQVVSMATFQGIDAEAIEYEAKESGKLVGKPLSKLRFPEGTVVAHIVRGKDAFVPHGESVILPGDRVIFFALPQALPSLEAKFL